MEELINSENVMGGGIVVMLIVHFFTTYKNNMKELKPLLAKVGSQVNILHDMHNQKNPDGTWKWFNDNKEMCDAIRSVSRTIDRMSDIQDKIADNMKTTNKNTEDIIKCFNTMNERIILIEERVKRRESE